jgi:mono/diheme cytochrome c family protein
MKRRLLNHISTFCLATVVLLSGCSSDPLSPGIEFMPDMYRSIAVKPYEASGLFKDSISSLIPVSGTITQGNIPNAELSINAMPYAYPDSPEGYEAAGLNLKNPLAFSQAHLDKGKDLYTKFCVHCHGDAGAGDGSLVKNGKFPSPGSYASKVGLTEGKMFHSMTYGKGLMGQHASQLNKQERWQLVFYVQSLIGSNQPVAAPADSTKKTK